MKNENKFVSERPEGRIRAGWLESCDSARSHVDFFCFVFFCFAVHLSTLKCTLCKLFFLLLFFNYWMMLPVTIKRVYLSVDCSRREDETRILPLKYLLFDN